MSLYPGKEIAFKIFQPPKLGRIGKNEDLKLGLSDKLSHINLGINELDSQNNLNKIEITMDKPLVTIALSAYNVGEYVDSALECIENQTYRNIEILCIDDASTDDTYLKISRRAESDSRYRIIRQERNQGLSVSRNMAISEAKGEYIVMLDGDDVFDNEMVEKSLTLAMRTNADMVMWDYAPFSTEEERIKRLAMPSALDGFDVNHKLSLLRRPAFMWVRLLRASKLKELAIRFEPGLTKQDIPVHWKLITSDIKISLLPERLSCYRIQPNATSTRKDRSVFSLAKVMDLVESDLKDRDIYSVYRQEFLRSRLSLLHGMYDFIKPEYRAEALQMIKERLNTDAINFLKSEKSLELRTRLFYGMISGDKIDKIVYKTLLGVRSLYRAVKNTLLEKL